MYTGRVETCSKRLYKALSIRGMKQAELCTRTKIPKSSMSLYLSGAYEPKQDRLYIIAEVLDIDPVWLMGYDVPMEKTTVAETDNSIGESKKQLIDFAKNCTEEQAEQFLKVLEAMKGFSGKK